MTDLWQWAKTRPPKPISTLEARFLEFDAKHPEVWTLFVRFSFALIRNGWEHYSADAVLHRVRWETDAGSPQGLKINNNFAAFYSRKFRDAYPDYAGFFRTRQSIADGGIAA